MRKIGLLLIILVLTAGILDAFAAKGRNREVLEDNAEKFRKMVYYDVDKLEYAQDDTTQINATVTSSQDSAWSLVCQGGYRQLDRAKLQWVTQVLSVKGDDSIAHGLVIQVREKEWNANTWHNAAYITDGSYASVTAQDDAIAESVTDSTLTTFSNCVFGPSPLPTGDECRVIFDASSVSDTCDWKLLMTLYTNGGNK